MNQLKAMTGLALLALVATSTLAAAQALPEGTLLLPRAAVEPSTKGPAATVYGPAATLQYGKVFVGFQDPLVGVEGPGLDGFQDPLVGLQAAGAYVAGGSLTADTPYGGAGFVDPLLGVWGNGNVTLDNGDSHAWVAPLLP